MKIYQSNRLAAASRIHHAFIAPGFPIQKRDNLSFKNGRREDVIRAREIAIAEIVESTFTRGAYDSGSPNAR